MNSQGTSELVTALATELRHLVEAHERLLVDSRITKKDAKVMREMLPHYTGSARAVLARPAAAGFQPPRQGLDACREDSASSASSGESFDPDGAHERPRT